MLFLKFCVILRATNVRTIMRQLYRTGLLAIAVLLMPLLVLAQNLTDELSLEMIPSGDTAKVYTKENPLIFEDDEDLWPYSFLSENHEEMGFNIDLVKMVLEKLDIPYVIRLKERSEVLEDLRTGRADLSLGMEAGFHNPYGKFGKTVIQLFTHSVVWPKGKPQTIFTLDDLSEQKVMVHDGSFSHHLMQDRGWGENAIPCGDMKETIMQLSQRQNGQMVWNTGSLRWLLRIYHIDDLQIAPVDMEDGTYKFMSNDEHLLARVDSIVNVLAADGRMSSLRTKWFYPDQLLTHVPSWFWNIVNAGVLLVALLLVAVLLLRRSEKNAIESARQRTNRLSLIMNSCLLSIWLYDTEEKRFMWVDKTGSIGSNYNVEEFIKRLGRDSYNTLIAGMAKVIEKKVPTETVELISHPEDRPSVGNRSYRVTISVLRQHHGRVKTAIGVCADVTDEIVTKTSMRERLMHYQSVFDIAMVDMFCYDANGNLIEMNERAQRTFGMTLNEAKERKVNILNIIGKDEFDSNSDDYLYASIFMDREDFNRGQRTSTVHSNMVYELQLVPVRSANGKLRALYGSGRDVTEVVNTYRKVQASLQRVQHANKEVTDYVQNINYVMGVGGVRLVQYSPRDHTLIIFSSLDTVQHTLTQSRCMSLVDDHFRKTAMRALNTMDSMSNKVVDAEITTHLRIKGHPLYLYFRFVPTFDGKGNVVNYFGMCRDQSDIKITETLLERQTARAKEVEDLKNSFLRNMSYEIRTPLATVVGFAELFEQDHSPGDEDLFVSEIKNNSSHLLTLINDILFLSRLDAHMIEMKKQTLDFSKTFDGYCHMGWAQYQREGVNYVVENHYDQLVLDIDDTNMGRIIEQVVANAAKYTTKGTVRTRYDYINDKLMIAVEDTGCGMSAETLAKVYERFASGDHHGTGLGLPICKELLEQMGGKIEITSKVGKGTTVWITLPCEAMSVDRRQEI